MLSSICSIKWWLNYRNRAEPSKQYRYIFQFTIYPMLYGIIKEYSCKNRYANKP